MTTTSRPAYQDILEQDEMWWPREGAPIRLDDMGPRHRRNTLAMIRRNAAATKFAYEINALSGPRPDPFSMAADMVDEGLRQLAKQDPVEWINEQPLVARLAELAAADHATSAPDEPDERIGKPLPCAHWCLICAEHGPITEPGAPLPCTTCPDCDTRNAAADDTTWN